MKHKKLIIGIAALLVVLGGMVWWFVARQNGASASPQTIAGTVADTSNGCAVDGICSVTLDNGKVIITGCGLMPNGKTCKRYDQSKLQLGQRIEATVMQTESSQYNLECDACTIRIFE